MKTAITRHQGDPSRNQVIVDGVDLTEFVQEISTTCNADTGDVFITLRRQAQDILIEGAVYVVLQPDEAVVMNRLKEVLASLDPGEVESAALARMQWGGSQKVAFNVLEAIKEVIQYACDEYEAAAKVRRGPDDRHDPGQAPAESSG